MDLFIVRRMQQKEKLEQNRQNDIFVGIKYKSVVGRQKAMTSLTDQ